MSRSGPYIRSEKGKLETREKKNTGRRRGQNKEEKEKKEIKKGGEEKQERKRGKGPTGGQKEREGGEGEKERDKYLLSINVTNHKNDPQEFKTQHTV